MNRTTANNLFSSNEHFIIYHCIYLANEKQLKPIILQKFSGNYIFRQKKMILLFFQSIFFFSSFFLFWKNTPQTVLFLFNVEPLPSRDYTWLKSIASFLPGCCRTRFSTNEIFSGIYARAEIFCYCLQCGKGYFLAMVGALCGFQIWTEIVSSTGWLCLCETTEYDRRILFILK